MTTTSDVRDEAVERELIQVYDEWLVALRDNDAERIGAFAAPDWVFVGQNGIDEGTRFLDNVRSGVLSHSMMDRVGEPRVRVYGDMAVLSVRVRNTAHWQDQRFDLDEWTTDVFVRRAGRWLCVLTHLTNTA
ncbi:nuclear transport factor 2 family protein [Nocardia puris]|uniref:nuclear transport factor 2 family protein n=1 Tax=Nocardia puris TaxID=208602 RepID=UPI0018953FFA|nr:nuclear transport factor 2 family protein [Nocardia puris]MBF6215245.1 nuclear transport factor 2 family protein [Nocardia puris]MBF6369705.1 nuclear transport factor 2 family protein [Nocardia puris]MBF6463415.1 nuclear transport factor 2 family protein [Nocardia puris]